MAWTRMECEKCMRRIVEYCDIDGRATWYDYIYACDGSCRTGKPITHIKVYEQEKK